MSKSLQLIHDDDPDLETLLYDGLNSHAKLAKDMSCVRTFGIYIKDDTQVTMGGAKGAIVYGNLHVDTLWLDKKIRYSGWGTKLMREAEGIGKDCGCTFATVNTMDWEALHFYQKLGYHIEFTRGGYENNSKMYMLRKDFN